MKSKIIELLLLVLGEGEQFLISVLKKIVHKKLNMMEADIDKMTNDINLLQKNKSELIESHSNTIQLKGKLYEL